MKQGIKHIYVLLLAMLLIVAFAACNKTDDQDIDIIKDVDGNVYKTVKIGTQVWMAENLKTTKLNDSTDIVNVTSNVHWNSMSTAAYCNYDNLESNVATYGRLYNWYAVSTGKLAPAGWHVPTDDDWAILENYLIVNGYNFDGTLDGVKIAKSLCATTSWELSSVAGSPGASPENNNRSDFSALSGGFRSYYGYFYYIGEHSGWWSSTENNESGAYIRGLWYDRMSVSRYGDAKQCGNSVRLVKDY